MAVGSRPAGADQIADLKTQAAAIAQDLVREQLQVGAYQQQYSVASAQVAADGRAIARIDRQINGDERAIGAATHELRQQAIVSYMNDGSELSGSDALLFSGTAESTGLTDEYTEIATGNVDTSLDALHLAQRALQNDERALQRKEARDQSAQAQEAADLTSAMGTEQQMASTQQRITGQLVAAVAAQAAAQAAAAAAAVAAAQNVAAQQAAQSTAVQGPAPGPPQSVSGSGPVLNAFLQCVVQAESGGNYAAVSPSGQYMGAFQFSQSTWNMAAQAAGLPNLIGVPPNEASPAEQDEVAIALYALDGEQPWLGDRCAS